MVTISSAAALRGSPLSGGYAGAKATARFINAYAGAEATSRSLGQRYVAILPQLIPATALGAAGVPLLDQARRRGRGTRLFEGVSTSNLELTLMDEKRLDNGSVILTYVPR